MLNAGRQKQKKTTREGEEDKKEMRASVDQDAGTPRQRMERTRAMFERVQEWVDKMQEEEGEDGIRIERPKSLFVEAFRELASSFCDDFRGFVSASITRQAMQQREQSQLMLDVVHQLGPWEEIVVALSHLIDILNSEDDTRPDRLPKHVRFMSHLHHLSLSLHSKHLCDLGMQSVSLPSTLVSLHRSSIVWNHRADRRHKEVFVFATGSFCVG